MVKHFHWWRRCTRHGSDCRVCRRCGAVSVKGMVPDLIIEDEARVLSQDELDKVKGYLDKKYGMGKGPPLA